jgi:uncharacterized protein YdeI (YjbR/CyaY-like superfamily)
MPANNIGDQLERVEITSADELRDWLGRNHDRSDGVWLVTYKQHVENRWVSRDDVLDELVAHGWTDGARRKLDDDRVMQLVSRRRTHIWARTYQVRAQRLIEQGRMHAAGIGSIEHAKQRGTWDEHQHVDDLLIPDDLGVALAGQPQASEHFDSFPPSHRRNVLRWLAKAKQPDTRTRRISEIVTRSAVGQRLPNL